MGRSGKVVGVSEAAVALGLSRAEVLKRLTSGDLRGRRINDGEFEIEDRVLRAACEKKSVSEIAFADYLGEQRLGPPDYEPEVTGKLSRIDYRLWHQGAAYWFEVKEFAEDPKLLGGGGFSSYDPNEFVREKIKEAGKNFKDYKGERCSVVVYNDQLNLANVNSWEILLSAMLGNLGYRFPINTEQGKIDGEPALSFGAGGRMVNSRTGKIQNTRIGAIIGLELLPVGKRISRIKFERRRRALGRRFTKEEQLELLKISDESYLETALRVVVCENPYAAWRLPSDLFTGPYDERWGHIKEESVITRLYIGEKLEALLTDEHELQLDRSPLFRSNRC